jgi:hypothetical protein
MFYHKVDAHLLHAILAWEEDGHVHTCPKASRQRERAREEHHDVCVYVCVWGGVLGFYFSIRVCNSGAKNHFQT